MISDNNLLWTFSKARFPNLVWDGNKEIVITLINNKSFQIKTGNVHRHKIPNDNVIWTLRHPSVKCCHIKLRSSWHVSRDEENVTESTGTPTWISPSVRTLSAAARRCWTPSTRPPRRPPGPRSSRSGRARPRPRERGGRGERRGQARGERSPSPGPRRNYCPVDLQEESHMSYLGPLP